MPTYTHRCGAKVDSAVAAFVHLTVCPLEMPRAARELELAQGATAPRPRSASLEGAGLDELTVIARRVS